jgi:LPS sulfotransferase NodH
VISGQEHLSAREERIGWIMGSSRSGSTWLASMLAGVDGATSIDDPHLGHHLGTWRPLSIAWATATSEPELTTLRELKRESDDYFFSDRYREAWLPALRDLITARFGAQLEEQEPHAEDPVLFVKEPGSQAAATIFELFPRSRLIFLLRDGRDVVESWLDAYQEGSWAIEGGAFPVARSGREALVRCLSAVWAHRTLGVAEAFARRPGEARVLVRYEDLLRKPATELGRICDLFGLTTSDLEAIAERHRFSRISPAERGASQHARSASPGRWRSSMSRSEQRAMEEVMGPVLNQCGYPPVRPAAA